MDQTIIQDVYIDLAKDDLTILEEHPHSGQRFDVFVSPRLALSHEGLASWEPEFQGCLDYQGVFGLHPRVLGCVLRSFHREMHILSAIT